MAGNESDSWDDYPWVTAEHRPPPKHLRKRKTKRRDLNQGEVPTAYMIRLADDGTKWHSIIDILRPNSPPVEWPEYPDRPEEDDLEPDFNWNDVSDFDDDPIKELQKMGIPEEDYKPFFNEKKFNSKLWKKIKKMQELRNKIDPELLPEPPPQCSSGFAPEIPELIDEDPHFSDREDILSSVQLPQNMGYGGGVTDRLDEDDYYPHDDSNSFKSSTAGLGQVSIGTPKDLPREDTKKDFLFDEVSEDMSSGLDEERDRMKIWRELQELE